MLITRIKNKYKSDWAVILNIAWPLIIANGFWNIQLTVDRMFLSSYATEALGAASAVTSIYWVPMALLQQTSGYVSTFIAQYFGAHEESKVGPVLWQSLYVGVSGGLLFLSLIYLAPLIFDYVGHSEQMKLLEVSYFRAICFSALPVALMASVSGFFTGLGKTKMVLFLNGVGVSLNVLFDYAFIFGNFGFPKLGVAGAGYATALASMGSVIMGLCFLFTKDHELKYKVKSGFKFQLNLMKRFLKFGLPSGLQWSLEGLAFTIFLIYIGRYPNGDAALAASSLSFTIMMLSILPAMGVSRAVQILASQALGEKKPEKAEELTWSGLQISTVYVAVMALSFVLFPDFYMSWFKNEDSLIWSEVSSIAPYLLMFVAVFVCFDSLTVAFSLVLKGAGDTKFVSIAALLLPWPLMVFPAYYVQDWGGAVYWAWAGASVFMIVQAIVFFLRFLGGKWKKMSVID